MNMQLVPQGKSHVELWAVAIADKLIVSGQIIHRRFAVMPYAPEPDLLFVRLEGWRVALAEFVTFAAPLNFSRNQVLAAGICSRPAYDKFMGLLRRMGVIVTYPKSGTIWAAGWDKRKFLVLLRRRMIEAPYPVTSDAPQLLQTRVLESQMAQPSQRAMVGWARTVEGVQLHENRK